MSPPDPVYPRLLPLSADSPRVAIKTSPEDFVVEELPLYEPCGTGTHTWLWIEKRGLTTHAAARILAAHLKKNQRDAGIAGLKDAQAVSRQWITFEHVTQSDDEIRAAGSDKLKILTVSRHANKLRMGHVRANRFTIRARPENESTGNLPHLCERVRASLAELERLGIPNYFGAQRFGKYGDNAALGRLLTLGDVAGFKHEMALRGSARDASDRRIRNLLVNAFQSELFNRVLAARMPAIGTLLAGDLAFLHRNGAVFEFDAAALPAEQLRADAHEISPSGPIFGPKMKSPTGAAAEIEAAVLSESGIPLAAFGRREAESQPGARRALRVFFAEPPSAAILDNTLELRFALPSGSYATVVLSELFDSSPLFPLRETAG